LGDKKEQVNEKETAEQKKEAAAQSAENDPQQEEQQPADGVQAQLEKANEELNKQKDLLLRTAAEYDNYRKRTEREKAAIYSDATAAAVTEFLPVADNLARALEQKECSAEDLRKGVEMVMNQMDAALKKLGVTEMGQAGEAFNPDFHNAVSHIDDENAEENSIVQVFQKGYKINDKVVRHAMVQVAN
jgi:molecular chaperone GrpE